MDEGLLKTADLIISLMFLTFYLFLKTSNLIHLITLY